MPAHFPKCTALWSRSVIFWSKHYIWKLRIAGRIYKCLTVRQVVTEKNIARSISSNIVHYNRRSVKVFSKVPLITVRVSRYLARAFESWSIWSWKSTTTSWCFLRKRCAVSSLSRWTSSSSLRSLASSKSLFLLISNWEKVINRTRFTFSESILYV